MVQRVSWYRERSFPLGVELSPEHLKSSEQPIEKLVWAQGQELGQRKNLEGDQRQLRVGMRAMLTEDGPYHCCAEEGQDYFCSEVTGFTLKKSFHQVQCVTVAEAALGWWVSLHWTCTVDGPSPGRGASEESQTLGGTTSNFRPHHSCLFPYNLPKYSIIFFPFSAPSLRFNFQNILISYLKEYKCLILVWADLIGDLEDSFVCSVKKLPEFSPWAWVVMARCTWDEDWGKATVLLPQL